MRLYLGDGAGIIGFGAVVCGVGVLLFIQGGHAVFCLVVAMIAGGSRAKSALI